MIPARFEPLVFGFFLSMIMSAVISAAATLTTVGFTAQTPEAWLWAWCSSWTIAFPAVLIVGPFARRIAKALTKQPG